MLAIDGIESDDREHAMPSQPGHQHRDELSYLSSSILFGVLDTTNISLAASNKQNSTPSPTKFSPG
eukprot:39388-Amphidinium_carterae.1